MKEFTNEDFERAAERVREMQRRAYVKNQPRRMPPVPDFVNTNASKMTPPQQPAPEIHNRENTVDHAQHKGSFGQNIMRLLNFKNLEMDSDRVLLAGLLLLLTGEEADEMLLLALIYIML